MLQVIALGAGLAIGLTTFVLRTDLDAQAVWWDRARWAIDHGQSSDEATALLGIHQMTLLVRRRGARVGLPREGSRRPGPSVQRSYA